MGHCVDPPGNAGKVVLSCAFLKERNGQALMDAQLIIFSLGVYKNGNSADGVPSKDARFQRIRIQ
jgi:hypothetical protein